MANCKLCWQRTFYLYADFHRIFYCLWRGGGEYHDPGVDSYEQQYQKRLGTSLTISRKQYSATLVANLLGELLENPNYAARAASIGEIIKQEDGVRMGCDAIEKQLQVL